jgi:hypothetical protein
MTRVHFLTVRSGQPPIILTGATKPLPATLEAVTTTTVPSPSQTISQEAIWLIVNNR